ncbi:protein grainyhead [Galendromus occidentalis]|uniref:Protein grainyhead n=1 Tax=Galendromus occidentalis TaxID=34638 RepID=A0AAJ7SIW6_9ACAR|nr:protein grainyhead [Galendromus occidentalis]
MALVMPEGAAGNTAPTTLASVATVGSQIKVEDSWRQYYNSGGAENPLSAAATAMINIHEEQATALMYESYAFKSHQIGQPNVASAALPELWSSQGSASPKAADSPHETDVFLNDIKNDPGSPVTGQTQTTQNNLSADSTISIETKEVALDGVPISVLVQVKQEPTQSPGNPNASQSTVSTQVEPKSPYSPVYATVQQAQPYSDLFSALSAGSGQVFVSSVQSNEGSSPRPVYTNGVTVTGTASTVQSTVTTTGDFYRDYYQNNGDFAVRNSNTPQQQQTLTVFPSDVLSNPVSTTTLPTADPLFVERYIRPSSQTQTQPYKGLNGLTVDLPSPDSGIGETMTPREPTGLPQIFDYSDIPNSTTTLVTSPASSVTGQGELVSNSRTGQRCRSWHEYGRSNESDKILIPKIHSDVGFKYYLESPISTSVRKEDDRITYINKGQFYGVTLEYAPDPDRPLKNTPVKSLVMLVFREEKSAEDEIKAWQFWHSRQHSAKQRILDADVKNSSGIVGPIEEITHNGIAFYWNPLEGPAKINVAVQCLSTDFSNQKGVKGLPLHIQVDTYDDYCEGSQPVHRGYSQIKVFCDKGAERKTRDEERRSQKRKLTATQNGRKKIEEMYHTTCDRTEFYSMAELSKPPVLFTPTEETEKLIQQSQQGNNVDLNFYTSGSIDDPNSQGMDACSRPGSTSDSLHDWSGIYTQNRERELLSTTAAPEVVSTPPPQKKLKAFPTDRVLLYVRQEKEPVFQALHVVPPSLSGLVKALENKYKVPANKIKSLYKQCKKGVTVEMDDDVVKHYCNEDTFQMSVLKDQDDDSLMVTLCEM